MDLQKLINKAQEAKQKGNKKVALQVYSDAFDILTKEAGDYARNQKGTHEQEGSTSKILPKFFEVSKSYLKRDKVASVVSNNIGVLLGEFGDNGGAKKMFNQAIDLTPDKEFYEDPKKNLAELEK